MSGWYPYKELGAWFRLDGSTLVECPMNSDGSRGEDDEGGPVEWDFVDSVIPGQKARLEQVMRELEQMRGRAAFFLCDARVLICLEPEDDGRVKEDCRRLIEAFPDCASASFSNNLLGLHFATNEAAREAFDKAGELLADLGYKADDGMLIKLYEAGPLDVTWRPL